MIVATVTAIALWGGWILSILLGRPPLDLFGLAIGHDFLGFFTAATLLHRGVQDRLYDFDLQHRTQKELAGGEVPFVSPCVNPPIYATFLAPLTFLTYRVALLVWSVGGLLAFYLILRLHELGEPIRAAVYVASFYPLFSAVRLGQNTLPSAVIFALAYYSGSGGHPFLAGLALSLLVYKPQLLLGPVLVIGVCPRFWPWVPLGLGFGGTVLLVTSWWWHWRAWERWVEVVRRTLPGWSAGAGGVKRWSLTTWPMFFDMLFPNRPGLTAWLARCMWLVGAVPLLILVWRGTGGPPVTFTAAILLTLWLAPHANDYEFAQLLLPSVLLWQQFPAAHTQLARTYSSLWCVMLLSPSFVGGQLALFGRAFHPAMPALGVLIWVLLGLE